MQSNSRSSVAGRLPIYRLAGKCLSDCDIAAELSITELALRESEKRFRLLANAAPVMIWMAGIDKLCNYFNRPWLKFTGRTLEAELGNGWLEAVHPDEVKACMGTYVEAFDRRESFHMQYRLRRHDGQYRWILDNGVPRFNDDGSFAGYVGSCMDITDRKLAEEALADVGCKLIDAQEKERTWIARELHDDINQRIACLAIELENWDEDLAESATGFHEHIHQIHQQLLHIGADIQALSYRLHSSKLEYLGLIAAVDSFCKELSRKHKVQIDFTHAEIPHNIPKELSLCLFRVVQEALQNAVKYSGVRHFRVELIANSGEIQLRVSDPGAGFDERDVTRHRGLGLISMRERVQMVSGHFSIESQLGRGTTIIARARLNMVKEEKPRSPVWRISPESLLCNKEDLPGRKTDASRNEQLQHGDHFRPERKPPLRSSRSNCLPFRPKWR